MDLLFCLLLFVLRQPSVCSVYSYPFLALIHCCTSPSSSTTPPLLPRLAHPSPRTGRSSSLRLSHPRLSPGDRAWCRPVRPAPLRSRSLVRPSGRRPRPPHHPPALLPRPPPPRQPLAHPRPPPPPHPRS